MEWHSNLSSLKILTYIFYFTLQIHTWERQANFLQFQKLNWKHLKELLRINNNII